MNERIVSLSVELSVEFRVYGYERAMSDTPLEKYRTKIANVRLMRSWLTTFRLRRQALIEYILYSLQSTISRTRRMRPSLKSSPASERDLCRYERRWTENGWHKMVSNPRYRATRTLECKYFGNSPLKGESDSFVSQNNPFEDFDGDEQAHLMHGRESWHCCLGERKRDRYNPTLRGSEECRYLSERDSLEWSSVHERNGCIGSGVNGSDGV